MHSFCCEVPGRAGEAKVTARGVSCQHHVSERHLDSTTFGRSFHSIKPKQHKEGIVPRGLCTQALQQLQPPCCHTPCCGNIRIRPVAANDLRKPGNWSLQGIEETRVIRKNLFLLQIVFSQCSNAFCGLWSFSARGGSLPATSYQYSAVVYGTMIPLFPSLPSMQKHLWLPHFETMLVHHEHDEK